MRTKADAKRHIDNTKVSAKQQTNRLSQSSASDVAAQSIADEGLKKHAEAMSAILRTCQ